MQSIKNEQSGFSLVELLVAMVIFMIIVIAFTALFTNSYTGIFRAGDKSESMFVAQADMDKAIYRGNEGDEMNLKIPFIGAPDIEANNNPGRLIEIEYEYQGGNSTIRYFLPAR